MSKKEISVIDLLTDENNVDNIFLKKADGGSLEFEQIAVIPHKDLLYAILRPVVPISGIPADEAVLFRVDPKTDSFDIEDDHDMIDLIYKEYSALYDAEGRPDEE